MLKYFVRFVLLHTVKTPSEFLDYIVQELLFFYLLSRLSKIYVYSPVYIL